MRDPSPSPLVLIFAAFFVIGRGKTYKQFKQPRQNMLFLLPCTAESAIPYKVHHCFPEQDWYLVFVTVSGSVSILLSALIVHSKRNSRHLSGQLQCFSFCLVPQTLACLGAKRKQLCMFTQTGYSRYIKNDSDYTRNTTSKY